MNIQYNCILNTYKDEYDSEVQYNKVSVLISWAGRAVHPDKQENQKDWEMADALVQSAMESSRTFTVEEAPWLLVPSDDIFQKKVSDLIDTAMRNRARKGSDIKNLKELVEGKKQGERKRKTRN